MATLVAMVWIAVFVGLLGTALLVREAALGAFIVVGVVLLVLTESLSLFGALTPVGLAAGWALALLVTLVIVRTRLRAGYFRLRDELRTRLSRSDAFFFLVVGVLAAGSLASVLLYPPSNWDSLTYHLPRVFFWLQNASVEHYPTAEARQLFSSPFANYAVLHVQGLTGGSDRFVGIPQWVSYLFMLVAVSLIAWRLGATVRGQQAATLAAATVPMAVLQASSTQNDLMCAAWCLVAVYGILAIVLPPPEADTGAIPTTVWSAWIAAAAALAFLTKPTSVLALAPFGVWLLVSLVRSRGVAAALRTAGLVLLGAAVLCAPWFARNAMALDGDPLGITAPGNTHLLTAARSPAGLLTNSLMNLSMLVALPVPEANEPLEQAVKAVGHTLGIAELESVMGEPGYGPYRTEHRVWSKNVAPAPVTTVLILLSAATILWRRRRTSDSAVAYLIAAGAGLLITATALGWQPWANRLLLPVLAILSPLVGVAFDAVTSRVSSRTLSTTLSALLVASVALGMFAMLFNSHQRLVPVGTSVWTSSYPELRFRAAPDMAPVVSSVVARADALGTDKIGIHQLGIDFPIYLLLASLDDTEVFYTDNLVLEDRLPQSAQPQLIVAVMPEDQYDDFLKEDPTRPERYLLPPRSATGWIVLLYEAE